MFKQAAKFLWHEKTSRGVIFAGGAMGALLRYGAGFVFDSPLLQVLFCNVLGTLILALIFEASAHIHSHVKRLVSTGFCGGLSTFATFSKDSVLALQAGDYFTFWANAALNFGLCAGVFLLVNIIADSYRQERDALRRRRVKMLFNKHARAKKSDKKGGGK